jgi:hypothetical protein
MRLIRNQDPFALQLSISDAILIVKPGDTREPMNGPPIQPEAEAANPFEQFRPIA